MYLNLAWDTTGTALFATAYCPTEQLFSKIIHYELNGGAMQGSGRGAPAGCRAPRCRRMERAWRSR